MKRRTKAGGARAGAGRKPVPKGQGAPPPITFRLAREAYDQLVALGGAGWAKDAVLDALAAQLSRGGVA